MRKDRRKASSLEKAKFFFVPEKRAASEGLGLRHGDVKCGAYRRNFQFLSRGKQNGECGATRVSGSSVESRFRLGRFPSKSKRLRTEANILTTRDEECILTIFLYRLVDRSAMKNIPPLYFMENYFERNGRSFVEPCLIATLRKA